MYNGLHYIRHHLDAVHALRLQHHHLLPPDILQEKEIHILPMREV